MERPVDLKEIDTVILRGLSPQYDAEEPLGLAESKVD